MSDDPDPRRDGHSRDHELPDEPEGLLSDADRSLADADQTLADTDQTASDEDQALSGLDQMASDVDQHASDRDQETADHDAESSSSSGWSRARYAASRAERLSNSVARYANSLERMRVVVTCDNVAHRRDLSAESRDATAEARDRLAEEREARMRTLPADRQAAVDAFTASRLRAGVDRRRAAADRHMAASDRVAAARDRQFAREALRHAHHDDVTGALQRELGELVLEHEVTRAHRHDRPLTIASLTDASETGGALDDVTEAARLVFIADTIRRHLQSFDTIVRMSERTFVCALPEAAPDDVARRLDSIRNEVCGTDTSRPVLTRSARLKPGETLADVLERAGLATTSCRRLRTRARGAPARRTARAPRAARRCRPPAARSPRAPRSCGRPRRRCR